MARIRIPRDRCQYTPILSVIRNSWRVVNTPANDVVSVRGGIDYRLGKGLWGFLR